MPFKTPYDFSKSEFKTCSGEMFRPTYKAVLSKNGDIELKEDGLELTYEKIQSFKDSVDINVIISRYAAGDVYALEQSQGFYGDFVSVPRSYMDVLNAVVDARTAYERTDMDISFEKFVDNIFKAVSEASKPVVEPVKSEVIDDVKESE